MITQDEFFKIFHDNRVEIHPKAKSFIEKRYIAKFNNMLPYKEVLARLTCDLSKDRPLDHPWIIRTSSRIKRLDAGNDAISVASSYLLTSVLSSKSKRMNIDNIIDEEEEIIDRVKKIDDKLREHGADDVKSAKQEMIQRAVNAKPVASLQPIPESKDEYKEKLQIKPTVVNKEEAK